MDGIKNPRRISSKKESRLALLSKMREAKGRGENLRIDKEEKVVYETVDETEYAKLVQERLEDDWIVDDDGEGYADDGREIFDDNDEDQERESNSRDKKRGNKSQSASRKSRINPDIRADPSAPLRPSVGRDIRSLFAATAAQQSSSSKKRKEQMDSTAVDPNLDDLLAELESTTPLPMQSAASIKQPKPKIRKTIPSKPSVSRTEAEENRVAHALTQMVVQGRSERVQDRPDIAKDLPPKKSRISSSTHAPKTSDTTPRSSRNPFSSEINQPVTPNNDRVQVEKPNQTRVAVPSKPTIPEIRQTAATECDTSTLMDDFPMDEFTSDDFEPQVQSAPVDVKKEEQSKMVIPEVNWLVAENEAMEQEEVEMSRENTCAMDNSQPDDAEGLQFYWFDAYEDIRYQPGVVFLFGKIKDTENAGKYKSCCLRIKDLERRIYLLPRSDLANDESGAIMKEVYAEFRDIAAQHKIGKFRCKLSTKRYAFEFSDVPAESEYLEIRYAASMPSLPSDLKGRTFSRVFGTTTSFLENLILELQLRGPCWLQIRQPVPLQPQISWCHTDVEVSWRGGANCPVAKLSTIYEQQASETKGKTARLPPGAPPLCLIAVSVKSVAQPQANHSEIVSVGLLIDHNYSLDRPMNRTPFQSHYLIMAPPKDGALPYDLRTKLPTWGPQYAAPAPSWLTSGLLEPIKPSSARKPRESVSGSSGGGGGVDVEPNERALLGRLLTRLHKLDPDLIVGHDLWGDQIELLLQRLNANKVAHWHRIGRLRRSGHFVMNASSRAWLTRHAMPGRLVCDTRVSARELVRSRTYNLSDLANQVLGGTGQAQRQVPPHLSRLLRLNTSSTSITKTDGEQQVVVEDESNTLGGIELADLEIDSADLRCLFASSDLVKQLIDFCLSDALLVLRLAHQLQVLPLAMQITSICGNVLSRTLAGGRAERNEALLLHTFTQHGFLVPDPPAITGRGNRTAATAATDDWDTTVASGEGSKTATAGRRKPTYAGGLVLEPKRGFYDKYILLLDFNSLYPSIIQEFNICFTTVDRELVTGQTTPTADSPDTEPVDSEAMIASLLATVQGTSGQAQDPLARKLRLPTGQSPGLLPAEIRRLVESRREVKKLIAAAATASGSSADPAQLAQWNTRQAALKLTANSVYGCLGFAASRFCARGLAALVTGLGRAVLMNTRDLVENMNLEVIYGDTDSIMVNTNTTDLLTALATGEKVRQEVNKRYRLLELDTDGVYAAMLLLAKKKYAALAICNPVQWAATYRQQTTATGANPSSTPAVLPQPDTKPEMKGLDIVRRDWSALAVGLGRRCVTNLLSGQPREVILERIHTDLTETAQKLRDGKLPLSEFIITKMLTKAPEDYADAKSLPHVQVAQRLNRTGCNNESGTEKSTTQSTSTRRIRAGDTVEYVICNDGTTSSATQRGYSPSELINRTATVMGSGDTPLTVDVNYYLAHQIHPVVSRLVAPIEGTSPARIADCLGLDPAGYRQHQHGSNMTGEDEEEESLTYATGATGSSGLTAWGDVEPLEVPCPRQCGGSLIEITASSLTNASKAWVCSNCSHSLLQSPDSVRLIVNRLTAQARQLIVRYQLGWLSCEDPACGLQTRTVHCPPTHTGGSSDMAGASGDTVCWGRGGRPLCPLCGGGQAVLKPRYAENRLYRQLCFFRHLVNTAAKVVSEGHANAAITRILQQARSHFDRLLSHSAYAMVDLTQLFAGLRGSTALHTRSGSA